jgi:CBS domain-containing protein
VIPLNTAKDIMVKGANVVAFSSDDSVRNIIAKLAQTGFSGGPVLKNGKVVGVISESDILTLADKSGKDDVEGFIGSAVARKKASDIMSNEVVTVGPDADVQEIADKMSRKKVNRVIVVDSKGALLGLIARDDIVEAAVHEL